MKKQILKKSLMLLVFMGMATTQINAQVMTSGPGDWTAAATWTGGVLPSVGDAVIINHPIEITTDVVLFNTLTVNSGSIKINAGKSLTVHADAITGGNINLLSDSGSYSSFIVSGSVTGDITYTRFTNAFPVNDFVSVPVSGEVFGDVAGLASNLLFTNPSDATNKLYGPYNNVTAAYETYKTTDDAAVVLIPGKGYRAGTTAGSGITYAGGYSNATVPVGITSGASNSWNLIGNPYASYLDFNVFYTANNTQLDGAFNAVYGFDGDVTDGYVVWNQATVEGGDIEKIAPGQGFFVHAPAAGGTVNFTTSMRTSANGNVDDFIIGKTSISSYLSTFKLTDVDNTSIAQIFFGSTATNGLDSGYDAPVFTTTTSGEFGLYTKLLDNTTTYDFAIQAISSAELRNTIVSLGVHAVGGKESTISLDNSNLPLDVFIYLEDKENNTFTLLTDGDYVFTPTANLTGTDRFNLHFRATVLSTENVVLNKLQIYASLGSLFVKGDMSETSKVSLFDIQGRLVATKKLDAKLSSNSLDVSNLETGVYLVKVNNGKQTETKKIIIK